MDQVISESVWNSLGPMRRAQNGRPSTDAPVVTPNSVGIFNIYLFQIMYAAWQDVLSLLFWKISALFSKSRIHEHLQLVSFKKKHPVNITLTSLWPRRRLKSPASRLFTQPLLQTQIKENIKALRHGPFVWGIHRDRWIPRTKGKLRGKCFHLMTSSWSSQNIAILSQNYSW